ncbi:MAG: hypothetical protein MZV65_52345 [Chromatiales bacterium]|nr:hypothetical protein [Chromatiales bacterium]
MIPYSNRRSVFVTALLETEIDLLFDRSMYRLYDSCAKKGIKFRMAAVPKDVNYVDAATEFDPGKMQQLFDVGYRLGSAERSGRIMFLSMNMTIDDIPLRCRESEATGAPNLAGSVCAGAIRVGLPGRERCAIGAAVRHNLPGLLCGPGGVTGPVPGRWSDG